MGHIGDGVEERETMIPLFLTSFFLAPLTIKVVSFVLSLFTFTLSLSPEWTKGVPKK